MDKVVGRICFRPKFVYINFLFVLFQRLDDVQSGGDGVGSAVSSEDIQFARDCWNQPVPTSVAKSKRAGQMLVLF